MKSMNDMIAKELITPIEENVDNSCSVDVFGNPTMNRFLTIPFCFSLFLPPHFSL